MAPFGSILRHPVFCVVAAICMIPVAAGSSVCSSCTSNNVTCADGICLPRCVNVTSSGECLMCRDFMFHGVQCETLCPHTCLNSRCQMSNSHVVCKEGCVVGKNGDNCGVDCPPSCTHCVGDECIGPCLNPRYFGPKCKTPCPEDCNSGCDKNTGKCKPCSVGYMGEHCTTVCPFGCKDGCHRVTGVCNSCMPWYAGDYCDVCQTGYRGKYCNFNCPALCTACERHGNKCIGACLNIWNYGQYCNLSCPSNCRERCEKLTGECDGCVPGFRGTYCNVTCPVNCTECTRHADECVEPCTDRKSYGATCQHNCPVNCKDGCYRLTGHCINCKPGYRGRYCKLQCSSGACNPAIAVSSSKPCTNCDRNNVTCVDGVCLPRCVSVTSSGECLQCRDYRVYGKHCEHDCPDTCLNSRCQMDNNRVVCTQGCVVGKKGDNCGVNCDAACTQCERYGNDCTGRCRNLGYYGPLCRTTCPSSCRGGCDKDTGECDKCDLGYNGSSEEMCLRCGPQFLYCDGQCFQCIGDNCHNSPCGTRHTYHSLLVVSGILAVIVLIGSACVVVNLARRKTRCRKRKTTQSGEEATDGRDGADHNVSKSDGSGHWAHKYWEIHDKATDTDSYVSILTINGLTVTSVNKSDVMRKQQSTGQESPSVSTDPAAVQSDSDKTRHHWENETMGGCFKHGGLNMNPEAKMTVEGPPDTASGGRAIQKPYLWKSSSLSDLVESRKTLVHNRCNVSLNCLSSNTQQLIRKTNSIILIERNCDLSQVYVRYLTPGKVDI